MTFATDERYLQAALASRAAAILLRRRRSILKVHAYLRRLPVLYRRLEAIEKQVAAS
jgi:hypothetical protein